MNSIKGPLLSIIVLEDQKGQKKEKVGLNILKRKHFLFFLFIIVSLENPEDTTKNF